MIKKPKKKEKPTKNLQRNECSQYKHKNPSSLTIIASVGPWPVALLDGRLRARRIDCSRAPHSVNPHTDFQDEDPKDDDARRRDGKMKSVSTRKP